MFFKFKKSPIIETTAGGVARRLESASRPKDVSLDEAGGFLSVDVEDA